MNEILIKHQKKFEQCQKTNYNEIFLVVKNFLNEINENKLTYDLLNYEFDDKTDNLELESISYLLSINSWKNINLMNKIRCFERYPFLVFSLLFYQKPDEIKDELEKIIDLYEKKYNTLTSETYKNLNNLKSYVYGYNEIIEKNSIFGIYNSFWGLRFDKIKINYGELQKLNDRTIIVFNVGYNLKESVENYLYDDPKNYFKQVLEKEFVEKSKYILKTQILKTDKLYFKIGTNDKKYSFGICYNNDEDEKKCYYSMDTTIFDHRKMDIFMNGGLIFHYPLQTYLMCVSQKYFEYKSEKIDISEDEGKIKMKISPLLIDLYSKDVGECIKNWNNWYFKEETDSFKIKVFKIYLDKLNQYKDENDDLNYEKYLSHLNMFFFLDK